MKVFIDTNIFLNFFDFSSEDLDELTKIAVLQTTKGIEIILTQQVLDEFRRNREQKIQNALKKFEEVDFSSFPQMIKPYPEYSDLQAKKREFQKIKKDILDKINSDKTTKSLKADTVIDQIFATVQLIKLSDGIYERARRRRSLGNPPGKKSDSIGDEVNWESLLAFTQTDEILAIKQGGNDLHLITSDRDWASKFNPNVADPYLVDEWSRITGGELFLYKQLSDFTTKHFPEIDLVTETRKQQLINDLCGSFNYAESHSILDKLSREDAFNPAQVNAILDAYKNNNQIYWIIADDDVLDFLSQLVDRYRNQMDLSKVSAILVHLEPRSGMKPDVLDKLLKVRDQLQKLVNDDLPF